MATKQGRRKRQRKPTVRKRPRIHAAANSPELIQPADRLADLPDSANAQTNRAAAILQLQRQLGNAAVQRHISRQVARQEDEEAVTVKLPDPKSLRVKLELEGHPFGLAIQREDAAAEEAVETPAADITLKLKDPKINRIPEKKVQEKHGKENIAGYTKPAIDISVQKLKRYEIKLTVTISFVMDLAKEYKGGRLQVLRDHENAHILIAEKVANEFVVGPLKDGLEAMPEFTAENKEQIQAMFQDKLLDFEKEEGDASELFDDLDYPRMAEAYHGVATPLADLASGSAEVKQIVETIDAFNDGAKEAAKAKGDDGDGGSLDGLVQPLIEAQENLGETDLARLQYNDEFKKKVAKAQKIAAALDKKSDDLPAEAKAKLEELAPILEQFTWQPELP